MEEQAVYWNVRSAQLAPGRYSGRHLAVHTRAMQLARSWRSHSTRIEGTVPADTLVLALPLSRHTPIQYRGRRLSDSAMIFLDHAEELDFSFAGAIDILTISVDREELDRRARAIWQEDSGCRQSAGVLCFSSENMRQEVAETIARIVHEGAARAGELVSEKGSKKLESAVLDCVLAAVEPRSRPEGVRTRQRSARLAREYLHAHCRQPVSVSDLCKATGTSRRSLHLGFVELYGVSPMRYLHALRLSGMRRELVFSPGQRITDVATHWGFDHLGRFAGAYRSFFGQLPSASLHSTPSGEA